MDFDPEDQEIIRLLTRIREIEGEYPQAMREARRRSFLRQMGHIGLGIGADQGIKNAIKDVKPAAISPAVSTLLETALVVAILAEAGTVAYFYRDQLTDFFRKIAAEPRVQEVTPPPVVTTSFEIQEVTPASAAPSTVPSVTILTMPTPTGMVSTPTSTPIPGAVDDSINNSLNTGGVNVLNSTPAPNSNNANNGNNGHHYGQTPKPERTKENGNNPPPKEDNDKPPKDNNDKPPKEDNNPPPKEEKDQPPKQK